MKLHNEEPTRPCSAHLVRAAAMPVAKVLVPSRLNLHAAIASTQKRQGVGSIRRESNDGQTRPTV
eukprot:6211985-Pleurochrysis_carterae.AAC.2